MTGMFVFTISLILAGLVALGITLVRHVDRSIRRFETEQERIRKRRLSLEAELELAYPGSDNDND